MSPDIHARLIDEAARRQCDGEGYSRVLLDNKSNASGQALNAASAALGRAIWKAMPRSLMFEGRRYRLSVDSLIGRIEVRALTGESLVMGIVEVRPE